MLQIEIEEITSIFKLTFIDANHVANNLNIDINEAIQNAFENAYSVKNFIDSYKQADEFILALKHSNCFQEDQLNQFIKFKNDMIRIVAKIDPEKIKKVKEMIRRNIPTTDIVFFENIDESEVIQLRACIERETTL